MVNMTYATGDKLRIGVLLTFEAQMLDVSGIDIFGMLDKEYAAFLPGPLSKLGLDVKIYYIGKDKDVSLRARRRIIASLPS